MPRFFDSMSQWFLCEGVVASFKWKSSGWCVVMIRRADGNGINVVTKFLDHLPVIVEFLCFRPFVWSFGKIAIINIADTNNVTMSRCVVWVTCSFTTNADTGPADNFVRRGTGFSGNSTGGPESCARCCSYFEEFSSLLSLSHPNAPWEILFTSVDIKCNIWSSS